LIINWHENLHTLHKLFSDKCYEKCELIDLIVEHNLIELLENDKMDLLITMYWNGPYTLSFFMNTSLKFWATNYLISKISRFSSRIGSDINSLSFWDVIFNRKKMNSIFEQGNTNFGHWFHFEVWRKSLKVWYFMNALMIFLFALFY